MNELEQISENDENSEIFKEAIEKIKLENKKEKQKTKKSLAKKLLEEKHNKLKQRMLRFKPKGPITFPPPWALNNGYSNELTLDRINNNGDYCPDNCRWISKAEQMNNRRNNHIIVFNNQAKTLTQWAKEYGFTYAQLYKRLKLGWSFEKSITEPIKSNNRS